MFIAKAKRRPAARGVTLVEAVIFIMIISIAVAGILLVLNNTTQHSSDPQLRKQALAVAESLLEEIELSGFTYCDVNDPYRFEATHAAVDVDGPGGASTPATSTPTSPGGCATAAGVENVGPEGGNARPFDNVNDYVSALNTPKTYTISDVNNTAVGNFTGTYTATVTISPTTLQNMESDPGNNPALGSALLITVNVSYNGGTVRLDGIRTQYAPTVFP